MIHPPHQPTPAPEAVTGDSIGPAIVARDDACRIRDRWREQGEKVVLTNGCFDLVHVGHLRYLQAARRFGRLIVGLNSDASVRRLKGDTRPIIGERERAELLAGLRCVDLVTIFDESDAVALLMAVRPNVYVKGADYAPGGRPLPEAEAAARLGTRVEIVELIPGHSTSALVEAIHRGKAAA